MQAYIMCPNCKATNPHGKVFCMACGRPVPVTPAASTLPLAQLQQQPLLVPPTQPININTALPYMQQPYVGPAPTLLQQGFGVQGIGVGRSGHAPVPATTGERIAIGIVQFFGWFWLVISILLAVGIVVFGSTVYIGYLGSSISSSLLLSLFIAPLVLAQGLWMWAITRIIASAARSLIIIRLNTA